MSRSNGASVVIVGGGVTGLSAGWWLGRTGIDVLVIDKGIIGWGASGRNGGGATHHYSPLFKEEQRLWPQMDELLGYPTEFRPYRIRLAFDERQFAVCQQAMRNAERQGFKSEVLDSNQLKEFVPLAAPDVYRAVFFQFGGHANPQRTVHAYGWAIQDQGGRIMQHATVTDIETRANRVVGVKTDRGYFGCDALVIAAGPQIDQIADKVEAKVPIACARNEIVATEPLPAMRHGGIDGNGLYGRQTLRGNLVYGGGPHEWLPSFEPSDTLCISTPLVRHIARRLARMFPGAKHARLLRSWAGVVENTPDGRPIIDRLHAPDNVVVATMSSVGFGLSPASGRAIAELVEHGKCSFADIAPFRLSRFSNLEPDWRAKRGWTHAPHESSSNAAPAS